MTTLKWSHERNQILFKNKIPKEKVDFNGEPSTHLSKQTHLLMREGTQQQI